MRFLHTADWHLGRLLHGERLTQEQSYALDQIAGIVREYRPDAVVIAGDIYDRAVPPQESVQLLDDILCRLVLGEKVPVLMIAGNHDSGDRLSFGARMLSSQGLHVAGALNLPESCVRLRDQHGMVEFHLLPYADPVQVRAALLDEADIESHEAAMRALLRRLPEPDPAVRRVLVAHAFVAGCEESLSERALAVGGAGTVPSACFEGFRYTAMGHLHRPQRVSRNVQYSGSLLKYSFPESAQRKCVHLVEMDAQGMCRTEWIPLTVRRDVRCVEGYFDQLLRSEKSEDYLQITLLDKGPVLDSLSRLREVFPYVLEVRRPEYLSSPAAGIRVDHRQTSTHELFSTFFAQVTGAEMTAEQETALRSVLRDLEAEKRESA